MVNTTSTAGIFGTAESPYGIGGQAFDSQIVEVPPNVEVVVGAASWTGIGPMNLQVLAKGINSQREQFNSVVIEAMLEDDAVAPAFETLKLGALAGELNFHPAVEDDANEETDAGADPAEARRAVEFCRRAHDNLAVPIPLWGRDALNALAFGHKVAEKVVEEVVEGPDAGLYTLSSLTMKPLWSYHLVSDTFSHLRALYCQTSNGPAYVDIEHFAYFAWDPKDNDPRGSSVFRAAKDPWRRKLRAKESRSKGDDQFGTPSVAHELPPNAPLESTDPDTGKPAPTVVVARKQLMTFGNGGAMVYANGGDLKVIESQRDGIQIGNSIDSYDRAITRSILLQAKATMEAKHYTQGGGEIGQGMISQFCGFVRDWFLSVVRRQIFHWLLTLNFGKAYADLYTPRLTIGAMPFDDFLKFASALGLMLQSGGFTQSQWNYMLAQVHVPAPKPGELRIGPNGPIPSTLTAPEGNVQLSSGETENLPFNPTNPALAAGQAPP